MMEDQIFGPKWSLPTYFDKRPQPSGNLFNLVDTVLKVGIEKAKKDVEEEGVEIIEKFLVEKESVILRLSDFAEQVFNQMISVQFQVGIQSSQRTSPQCLELDPESITEAQAHAVDRCRSQDNQACLLNIFVGDWKDSLLYLTNNQRDLCSTQSSHQPEVRVHDNGSSAVGRADGHRDHAGEHFKLWWYC